MTPGGGSMTDQAVVDFLRWIAAAARASLAGYRTVRRLLTQLGLTDWRLTGG
jgi:hypothetical protein